MTTRSIATALVMLSAGCSDGVAPGAPGAPSFTPDRLTAWAGGTFEVESAAFVGLTSRPVVTLGPATLEIERQDDNSFAVRIPSNASGIIHPTISLAGETHDLPAIAVGGFTGSSEFTTAFIWDLESWRWSDHATVVGAGSRDDALVFIDLDAGTERIFPGVIDIRQLHGPGASYRSRTLFGTGPNGITAFREGDGGLDELELIGIHSAARLAEIGPATYLRTGDDRVEVIGGPEFQQVADEPEGILLSHFAARATIRARHVPDGLPVFSVPTGALAYRLDDVTHPHDAAFSSTGSLLAVIEPGELGVSSPRVRTFRASDGVPIATRSLPSEPFALAFDLKRSVLYVGLSGLPALSGASRPRLLVLDAATLRTIGEASADASPLQCSDGCFRGRIAVGASAVYVVASAGLPTRSYRFSIPELK